MTKLQGLFTPVGLMRVLVLTMGAALVVVAVFVLFFLGVLKSQSSEAFRTSQTALLASEAESELARLQLVLGGRIDAFLISPQVLDLPPARRLALTQELRRTDAGPPAPGTDGLLVPLSMSETIAIHDVAGIHFSDLETYADEAMRSAGGTVDVALHRYFDEATPSRRQH